MEGSHLVQQKSRDTKDMKSNIPLHSIRKPQSKPWRKPKAPLQQAPALVYKVNRMDFRDVVQKLTGAPEFQTWPRQCRQSSAVPPLDLVKPGLTMGRDNMTSRQEFIPFSSNSVFPDTSKDLMSEPVDTRAQGYTDNFMVQSFLGMNSPTMHNWVPLLSPRSLLSHLQ